MSTALDFRIENIPSSIVDWVRESYGGHVELHGARPDLDVIVDHVCFEWERLLREDEAQVMIITGEYLRYSDDPIDFLEQAIEGQIEDIDIIIDEPEVFEQVLTYMLLSNLVFYHDYDVINNPIVEVW